MILLNHWRDFQNQLIHTHTNFQLIPMSSLSGRSGILLVILYSSIITQCWIFRCIFMVLSGFLSNHKRFEVWYLTYLCINFQLLAMRGLPSELDNILVLLFVNNCKWLCDCLSYSNLTISVYQISRYSSLHVKEMLVIVKRYKEK